MEPTQVATTVTVDPASVSFSALGDAAQLTATVLDQNGNTMDGASVSWSSSDEAVAWISSGGRVTASANGTATVSATAGDASGSSSVSVAILPTGASYEALANTELVTGGVTRPATPVVNDLRNVLAATPGTAVVSLGPITTSQGGEVVMEAAGGFRYLPPAGLVNAVDSFSFTVEGDATATVAISISGPVIWYVDNRAEVGASGRSDDPFGTLAEAEAVADVGHTIFLFAGDGTTTGQDQGITLQSDQQLIGEGVGLTIAGFSELFPAGARPVLTNGGGAGVTLANWNRVAGLEIVDPLGAAVRAVDVHEGRLDELNIIASSDAALWFEETTGEWTTSQLTIQSADSAGGVVVLGGNPDLTLDLSPSGLENLPGAGHAIQVDATLGGVVLVQGGPVHERGGGIAIRGAAGDVDVQSHLDVDTTAAVDFSRGGIRISGSSGTMTFADVDIATVREPAIGTSSNSGLITLSGRVNAVDDNGLDAQCSPLVAPCHVNATFSSFIVHNERDWLETRTRTMFVVRNDGFIEVDTLDVFIGGPNRWQAIEFLDASFGGGFRVLNPESRIVAPSSSALSVIAGSFDADGGGQSFEVDIALDTIAGNGGSSYSGTALNLWGVDGTLTVARSSLASISFLEGTLDVDYGGEISGSLRVGDQEGSTMHFSGPVAAGGNISIESTTGTSISFSGGIDMNTGGGFSAVNNVGGSIEVTGDGNVISTTTAPAVVIEGSDIGAGGVTFESVSSDGAEYGISLTDVGGPGTFAITGSGSVGTGGTIANSTTAGVILDQVQGVSLGGLTVLGSALDGVSGTTVADLVMNQVTVETSGDRGVQIDNLTGVSALANSSVTGSAADNVLIETTGLGELDLTVSGNTLDGTSFNSLTLAARGSSVVCTNIFNNIITNDLANGIDLTNDAGDGSVFEISGLAGAGVSAFLSGQNTITITGAGSEVVSVGLFTNGAC